MCVYFNKPYSLPFPEGERAPWIQKAGMEVMVRQEKRRITRGRRYNKVVLEVSVLLMTWGMQPKFANLTQFLR